MQGSPSALVGLRPVRARVTTSDGWSLEVTRGVPEIPMGDDRHRPPVLFVPGYGMNAHLFHHHPSGPSFAEVLYAQGFDPWSVDLRGTRSSRAPSPRSRPRLADQAFRDLPAVLDHVAERRGVARVHAIGCSLGGALLYAHGGRDAHRIDRLVTMGSPLVMVADTAILRALAAIGPLAARVPVRGTRPLARIALPWVARVAPEALSFYLNPALIDLARPARLVQTVEDPSPTINVAMSAWARDGRLRLDGHDVTEGLSAFDRPLLVTYAAEDGVCVPRAALTAVEATGGPVEVLRVDHPDGAVRHADLFIARFAPTGVFPSVAAFLRGAVSDAQPT